MRCLLLSLTVVIACGGNSEFDVAATVAKHTRARPSHAPTASCPISSAYTADTRFQITAAVRRSATGTLSSEGTTRDTVIRNAGLAPDEIAVELLNGLGETVNVKTFVVLRRTNGRCAPPTGKRVAAATALIPGVPAVIRQTVRLSQQVSAVTLTVSGTTATGRNIRTPEFVLPIPRGSSSRRPQP